MARCDLIRTTALPARYLTPLTQQCPVRLPAPPARRDRNRANVVQAWCLPLFKCPVFLGFRSNCFVAPANRLLTSISPPLFQSYFAVRLFGFAVWDENVANVSQFVAEICHVEHDTRARLSRLVGQGIRPLASHRLVTDQRVTSQKLPCWALQGMGCSDGSANWRLRSGRKLIDRTPSEECSYRKPMASSGPWASRPCAIESA